MNWTHTASRQSDTPVKALRAMIRESISSSWKLSDSLARSVFIISACSTGMAVDPSAAEIGIDEYPSDSEPLNVSSPRCTL